MIKPRALTGMLSVIAFLTLVSSARADVVHADINMEKLIFGERHNLAVFDIQSEETSYLYTGHFENNNGKHLGFSITSVNRGPKLGIVRPAAPSVSVSQNPEPATMVLLGTGLAAVGAFARKKSRRRIL